MAERSSIEWLKGADGGEGSSWNPIRARDRKTGRLGHHCEHVHEGCRDCYAEAMNLRFGTHHPYKPGHRQQGEVEMLLDEAMLLKPLRWRKPRRIFVCSMTDLYAPWVKDEWLDAIKAVQMLTPWHTYIELTKRPERMRAYLSDERCRGPVAERLAELYVEHPEVAKRWPLTAERAIASAHWPIPNVIAGPSCSTQEDADAFIPPALAAPLARRVVSLEPLLGPIDLTKIQDPRWSAFSALAFGGLYERARLDWVIVGGESRNRAPRARPMHPDWALALREQCRAAGVAFFFKQWGDWVPLSHAPPELELEGWRSEPIRDAAGAVIDGVFAVGKHNAGRLLDGATHDGFPA